MAASVAISAASPMAISAAAHDVSTPKSAFRTNPITGKIELDAAAHNALMHKYDKVLQGMYALKQQAGSTLSAYRTRASALYALMTGHHEEHRRLNTLSNYQSDLGGIIEALTKDEITGLADLLSRFQGITCVSNAPKADLVTALTTELQSTVSDLSQAAIGDVLNSLFGCACSAQLNFGTAEHVSVWSAGKVLVTSSQSDADIISFIQALKAVIPAFLGGGGLCGSDCSATIAALINLGIQAAQQLAKVTLPAATSNLATSAKGCVCNGPSSSYTTLLDTIFPIGSELSTVNAAIKLLEGQTYHNGQHNLKLLITRVAAQIDVVFSSAQLCGGDCARAFDDATETFLYAVVYTLWPHDSTGIAHDLLKDVLPGALVSDLPSEAVIGAYADTLRSELCVMDFAGLATSFERYIVGGIFFDNVTVITNTAHDVLSKLALFECDAGGQIPGETVKMISSMIVRVLETPFDGFQVASPGLFTKAIIDELATAAFGCACHYFRTDTEVLPLVTSKLQQWANPGSVICPGMVSSNYCDCSSDCTNNPSWCACSDAQACCAGSSPSTEDDILSTLREVVSVSSACGSTGCRSLFTQIHTLVSRMSDPSMTGVTISGAAACSAANGATCFGTKQSFSSASFSGSSTCAATPLTGTLPKPMNGVDAYTNQILFWSTCWMSTDCPPDGVSEYEVTVEVVIQETVQSFDATKQQAFKQNFITMVGGGVSVEDITLTISSGSLIVSVAIKTASSTVKEAVSTTIASSSTTAMSSALGVAVISAQPAVVATVTYSPPPPPPGAGSGGGGGGGGGGGDSTGAIIGGIVGGIVVIGIIVGVVMYMKKNKNKNVKVIDASA